MYLGLENICFPFYRKMQVQILLDYHQMARKWEYEYLYCNLKIQIHQQDWQHAEHITNKCKFYIIWYNYWITIANVKNVFLKETSTSKARGRYYTVYCMLSTVDVNCWCWMSLSTVEVDCWCQLLMLNVDVNWWCWLGKTFVYPFSIILIYYFY